MDNNEILNKMHSLHLILADELKRICEKHNIKYFMIAGTLLGAVRHSGFIPWDNDMDFGMPREDYERFIEICAKELDPTQFYLQTDRNDKYYAFNFGKLRLEGTKVIESFSSSVNTNQGIYIDIFPIDTVTDGIIKRAIQLNSFWFYRNLLWIKCGYGSYSQKKQLKYKVAKLISRMFTIDFLKKMKHKSISKYCKSSTQYVVTSDGSYGLKKERLKSEWIEKIKDYEFENRIYPGLLKYEEYLTYFYGDYMKLPPEEKRNHHGCIEVDFGPYGNKID